MSWGFTILGKPGSVVSDLKKVPNVPSGLQRCIEECAAQLPQGEMLFVESNGHFDAGDSKSYGSFNLTFKMQKAATGG